jgi:hypothetical protein
MAGILNKKTRFIDLIITKEGKRQIASGQLRPEYASLTDGSIFYNTNQTYSEVCNRLYFEVMNRFENSLAMESDDSGKLQPYTFSASGSIVGNNDAETGNLLFTKDASESNLNNVLLTTGSQFSSLASSVEKSFFNHFKKNYFIGTDSSLSGDKNNQFELNKTNVKFDINDIHPFNKIPNSEVINVNNAEPFLLDSKLTHLDNFKFLPPVNENGTSFGSYSDIRSTNKETWEDILLHLGNKAFYKEEDVIVENFDLINNDISGNETDQIVLNEENITFKKQFHTFYFKKTSFDNNIILQMFEKAEGVFTKLDVIDAGVFFVNDDINKRFEKHVYYIGKIFFDDYNTPTFINLFTIVFD